MVKDNDNTAILNGADRMMSAERESTNPIGLFLIFSKKEVCFTDVRLSGGPEIINNITRVKKKIIVPQTKTT